MAELEDNNAVIDLERLTSKVDIKDDEATTLDKHNEMLMTTEKLARQSTRPHSSQDDFYVLVLIDMYSHQVCVCLCYNQYPYSQVVVRTPAFAQL